MAFDSGAIRNLVQDALVGEDLNNLCFDHFRPVYDQYSGQGGTQVRMLVEYAQKQREIPKLLKEIENTNPNAYHHHIQEILAAPHKQGCDYMDRAEWQKALDKFEEIQTIQSNYKNTEALVQRCHIEIRLAALYSKGQSYMRAREWQKALDKFEEIQRIQPNYRNPEALAQRCRIEIEMARERQIPRAQRSRLASNVSNSQPKPPAISYDILLSILVVVIGWVVAWFIGKHSNHSLAASPTRDLAGWIGGLFSGLSIFLMSPQTLSNFLRNPLLQLAVLGVAGSFVGVLIWSFIDAVASKSSLDAPPVTIQAIASACISIGILLYLKFGLMRS